MTNVLVTGSRGFIGNNLISVLSNRSDINVLEYTRTDSYEILDEHINKSDFIFHFAGEVRPQSCDDDFVKSNVDLTQKIIDSIKNCHKHIPILMASSIHAGDAKNTYGKTKRDSEIIIENYAKKHSVPVCIFRLPHIFGEGCKPNYNSVITTWIYNSINELDITVYSRDVVMNYCYVQDVIHDFVNCFDNSIDNGEIYRTPSVVYRTTLGDIADLLDEFHLHVVRNESVVYSDEFKTKLFDTYLSYVKSIGTMPSKHSQV